MDNDKMNLYIDYINQKVLSKINYQRLQADYATQEKAYAKSVLNALHQGVQAAYGTETFDDMTAGGYVLLPGVVQSKTTGSLCVALLELDLQSSGEHCGTDFITKYGCVNQFDDEMPKKVRQFLKETYGSYDYCYTATLEDDIHVNKQHLPPQMKEFLETFQDHTFVPVSSKEVLGNINDYSDEEDMER